MRAVAKYSLLAETPNTREPLEELLKLVDHCESWISAKGERVQAADGAETIRYRDGREATLRAAEIELDDGALREITLTEPLEGTGLFQTRLTLGYLTRTIAVSCDLRVGGRDDPLGPVRFDASCPRILRDLLSYDLPWAYRTYSLPESPRRLRGHEAGKSFAQILTDPARLLPVVTIAEHDGFVLHPSLPEALARDLACLAGIVVLDQEASWAITRALGADWSCYNGAIRLYWPGVAATGDPKSHPLWTARRLLEGVQDTEEAATRIRSQLRRRVLAVSAFTVREPALFETIRAEDRKRRFAAERAKLTQTSDFAQLAESYAKEAEELRTQLRDRDEEIEGLNAEVSNLRLALQWQGTGEAEESLPPDPEVPPTTVEEAVERAKREAEDALVFGPDVDAGVRGLAQTAGPPEKVHSYLTRLAEMSRARAAGTMGTSTLEWLKQRNVSASQEGEGVVRMWGGRSFDWHLKPSEAVSPDKCVRIYFEWDEELQKLVVGWVGRHP